MELQHIISVDIIDASTLNIIDLDADIVRILGVPEQAPLNIRKPASLAISTSKNDGALVSTCTLTFMVCELFLQKGNHYAFLATGADGTRYLIGRSDRPYPVITTTKSIASDFSSSQLTQVSVTWTKDGYIPTCA